MPAQVGEASSCLRNEGTTAEHTVALANKALSGGKTCAQNNFIGIILICFCKKNGKKKAHQNI